MTTPNRLVAGEPDALHPAHRRAAVRLAEFDELFTGVTAVDRLGPGHVRMRLAVRPGWPAAQPGRRPIPILRACPEK